MSPIVHSKREPYIFSTKFWIKFMASLVLISGILYSGSVAYLDILTSDMDSSEFPESSFEDLDEQIEDLNVIESTHPDFISDSNVNDRLRLSTVFLIDSIITFEKFESIILEDQEDKPKYTGIKIQACLNDKTNVSTITDCDSERTVYDPEALQLTISWLMLAKDNGSANAIMTDKSDEFVSWIERSIYYDDTLEPNNFNWTPLEVVIYEEGHGLYIIGERLDEVEINSESYNVESTGIINHINTDLDKGVNKVSARGQEVELTVHPRLPPSGINSESNLEIGSENQEEIEQILVNGEDIEVKSNEITVVESDTDSYNVKFEFNEFNYTREEIEENKDPRIRALGTNQSNLETVKTIISAISKISRYEPSHYKLQQHSSLEDPVY